MTYIVDAALGHLVLGKIVVNDLNLVTHHDAGIFKLIIFRPSQPKTANRFFAHWNAISQPRDRTNIKKVGF